MAIVDFVDNAIVGAIVGRVQRPESGQFALKLLPAERIFRQCLGADDEVFSDLWGKFAEAFGTLAR